MDIDSDHAPDLIASLGYMCLGSRLKRLGERMQAGVTQHLVARGIAVQPAQLPLLWALRDEGPLTIGALSDRLGISQPGVSRAVAALERLGMIGAATAAKDKRQRRIMITPQAQALLAALSADLFPAVQQAVEALCLSAGPDFLGDLGRIEDGLGRDPLDGRIGRAMRGQGMGGSNHRP
jgi:DNA-binding MarR family transcriptional regulator